MRFQTPLVPGRLRRRWMRFLSEVELDSGEVVRAHCPNPGAMTGLKEPGLRVWLEPNDDPRKKLDWGWRLAELPGAWVGIDTAVPNRVAGEALRAGAIPELAAYGTVRPEVRYGTRSRIDYLLTEPELPDAYVEVKNVHLRRTGDWAEFPDSVTDRGRKHLAELTAVAAAGQRAVMLYLVQRDDCARFRLAGDIDPAYARAFDEARQAGVEMLCYACAISPAEVTLSHALPVDAARQGVE